MADAHRRCVGRISGQRRGASNRTGSSNMAASTIRRAMACKQSDGYLICCSLKSCYHACRVEEFQDKPGVRTKD